MPAERGRADLYPAPGHQPGQPRAGGGVSPAAVSDILARSFADRQAEAATRDELVRQVKELNRALELSEEAVSQHTLLAWSPLIIIIIIIIMVII